MSDRPNLTPDESVDALAELLAKDREIEDISLLLAGAKATYDDLKAQLKDAQEARNTLSREIRNKPMPLFDRPAGRAATTACDDDVAEGVRAAEARDDINFCGEFTPAEEEATRAFVEDVRREGEWDLDGAPISPEAMPRLSGPAKPKRGRKAAARA